MMYEKLRLLTIEELRDAATKRYLLPDGTEGSYVESLRAAVVRNQEKRDTLEELIGQQWIWILQAEAFERGDAGEEDESEEE